MGKRGRRRHRQPVTCCPLRGAWRAVVARGGSAVLSPRHVPVIVRCHLCPADDGRIVTTASRAWWAAMDHALDEHRAELLAAPEATAAAFTVSADGAPRPLTSGRS